MALIWSSMLTVKLLIKTLNGSCLYVAPSYARFLNTAAVEDYNARSASAVQGIKSQIRPSFGLFVSLVNHLVNIKCNVFQAEIFTVLNAAERFHELAVLGDSVDFHLASLAAIRALIGRRVNSFLIVLCRSTLTSLLDECSVKLCWVPRHAGIRGSRL